MSGVANSLEGNLLVLVPVLPLLAALLGYVFQLSRGSAAARLNAWIGALALALSAGLAGWLFSVAQLSEVGISWAHTWLYLPDATTLLASQGQETGIQIPLVFYAQSQQLLFALTTALIGLAVLLGTGFAGFTVSAALGSGSAAATQGASFIFFPLTFLAPTFVPLTLLSGWLAVAARLNPITYVLEAMRTTINSGWNSTALLHGLIAVLVLAAVTYALAVIALRVRTRRS